MTQQKSNWGRGERGGWHDGCQRWGTGGLGHVTYQLVGYILSRLDTLASWLSHLASYIRTCVSSSIHLGDISGPCLMAVRSAHKCRPPTLLSASFWYAHSVSSGPCCLMWLRSLASQLSSARIYCALMWKYWDFSWFKWICSSTKMISYWICSKRFVSITKFIE